MVSNAWISRRQLLRAAGTASALAAASPLLIACDTAAQTPQPSTPKPGGTLRIGVNTNIRGLDPHAVRTADEQVITHSFGEALFDWRPDGSLKPSLATSLESNQDNTAWTVKIRSGVIFHNGEPLTAQSVAESLAHQANPKTVGLFGLKVGFIDSIKAVDSETVVFKLHEPYAKFQQILADPSVIVIPASTFATANEHPIGTGPWKFRSFEPGLKVTLERNQNYWRKERPYIDNIEVNIIPDAATREQALIAGQIDLMHWVPVDAVPRLQKLSDVTVYSSKANLWQPLCMHAGMEPFTDPLVREAMQYLVDRDEVVNVALFGQGSAVNGFPDVPGTPYYPSQVPAPGKDLARVRSLLSKSRYPKGFEVDLWYGNGYSEWVRVGEMLKQSAAEAGITINLKGLPRDQFFATKEGQVPFFLDNWAVDLNLDLHTTPFYTSKGPLNLTKEENPQIDKVLAQARTTNDPAVLKQLYGQFTEEANKGTYITLYVRDTAHAARSNVRGFSAHPDYLHLEIRDAWLT